MTRCKICGITNRQDAVMAIESGAAALGFVFYRPSPRYIAPAEAADIISELPPFITTTGLFVNHAKTEIEHILTLTKLDLLQFHGDENEPFCASFRRPYIKAFGIDESVNIQATTEQFASARAFLLDTLDKKLKGGTGKTFNWQLAQCEFVRPIILAGGLNPANVRKAIQQVRPFGVDVSGGVERCKGKKDPQLVKAFLNEVHSEYEI